MEVGRGSNCDLIAFQGKVGAPGPAGLKGEKVRSELAVRDPGAFLAGSPEIGTIQRLNTEIESTVKKKVIGVLQTGVSL